MNLEDVKIVLDYGKEEIRNSPKLFILFRTVYNENIKEYPICASCPGGYESAYNYLTSVYLQNVNKPKKKIMSTDQKFVLKKGGVIHSDLSPTGVFTPENCSDEDAIHLLQQSENAISSFEKYPENWKELVANEKSHYEKVTGKKSRAQLEKEAEDGMNKNKKSEAAPTGKVTSSVKAE